MTPVLYKIELLTNLHVGSGEVNYSVIDKEVERDAVLGEATIHASGVKGALKDHCRNDPQYTDSRILEIFGDEIPADPAGGKDDKKAPRSTSKGTYKFFSAQLLARPLRVTDGSTSYVLATTRALLSYFSSLAGGVGLKVVEVPEPNVGDTFPAFVSRRQNLEVEGKAVSPISPSDKPWVDLAEKLIKKPFVIADSLKDYNLPVMAHNSLDNQGLSKNLWYEEYVPHQSQFYFIILTPNDKDALTFPDVVQFGGNASTGCGYARVTGPFNVEG